MDQEKSELERARERKGGPLLWETTRPRRKPLFGYRNPLVRAKNRGSQGPFTERTFLRPKE